MQTAAPNPSHAARASGILLIVTTVLSIAAMSQHPSLTATTVAQAVEQLKALATQSAWVHGSLIALMLMSYWALTEFALRRGVERPLVRAGLIFYGAGVMAMIGAASVSGYMTAQVPNIAARAADPDLHLTALLINFCGLLNQTMANLGMVAMSAGILAWSIGLLHSAGWPRVVGGIGVLVGVGPAVALMAGGLHLNVVGMMLVILGQAVWNIGIGVLLIMRRV
jgi:hypothetical protein